MLPCTIRGTTYLCRNGIYVKKQGKADWRPCSNFSVRIEESLLMENGQVAHRVLLQMAWRTADFTISSREMDDGRLLLDKLEAVAIQHGYPDLPQAPDPTDLRRLPQVIQTTQLKIKAPMRAACRPEFGFVGGHFHGPDFSTTAHSMSFHSIGRSRAEFPVPWMRPEEFWGNPDDHLVCRANELATWLETLEPPAVRMASIMLCAALNWLHRASRGLPSYLLLPSETHLEFLGRLTGLIPIEVGRGPREHLGTPRLMRSSYWRPDQFQRHGRIVAALEDRTRRIDRQLPMVLHSCPDGIAPVPPAAILSLLTHCVLGARQPLDASTRLVSLVECPDLRRNLQAQLAEAASHWVDSGCYLDIFFAAARKLSDLESYVIRQRANACIRRDVVQRLNEHHGFCFRETRLIDELRQRFPLPQPARHGKEQTPVFRLLSEILSGQGFTDPPEAEYSETPLETPEITCSMEAATCF